MFMLGTRLIATAALLSVEPKTIGGNVCSAICAI
jgi:hypothetical protein